eukprot:3089862-Ditylum_brightwellii.AAC.1
MLTSIPKIQEVARVLSQTLFSTLFRVEIISDEERLAHASATEAKINADEGEKEWNEWKIQHGVEMATIQNERLGLNEWQMECNDDGTSLLYSKDER